MDRKRIGRPKVDNPKNKNITFRVTQEKLDKVIELCEKHNIRYVDIFDKGFDYWSRKK